MFSYRRLLVVAIATVGAVIPATSAARTGRGPTTKPTPAHARQYQRAYYAVAHKLGHRAPGRQILRWGFAPNRAATDAEVVASLAVLGRMLNPPPVQTTPSTSSAYSSSSTATGGWVIPSAIVQCESGGQNLAPNSASAAGYYQITHDTWNGYGGYSSANEAPKSVQDAKAAQLWNGGAGAGDWVCKG